MYRCMGVVWLDIIEADMMVTTSACLVHVQVEIILTGYLVLTNRTVQ